jgi:hypothetical protein
MTSHERYAANYKREAVCHGFADARPLEAIRRAVAEEREACARLVDQLASFFPGETRLVTILEALAAEIRTRGGDDGGRAA